MSRAEEMLATMSASDDSSTYLSEEEPHIIIDNSRTAFVPSSLKTIAVTGDHQVEKITFDCVRFWDGNDLSTFAIYLNYVLPDLSTGTYIPSSIVADNNVFHFDWDINNNITKKSGKISFAITAIKTKKNDSGETVVDKQWSSIPNGDCSIVLGIDISNVPSEEESSDVLAQMSAILEQMQSNIVQTIGQSTTKVMSQKAATDNFALKSDLNILKSDLNIIADIKRNYFNQADAVTNTYYDGNVGGTIEAKSGSKYYGVIFPVVEGKSYVVSKTNRKWFELDDSNAILEAHGDNTEKTEFVIQPTTQGVKKVALSWYDYGETLLSSYMILDTGVSFSEYIPYPYKATLTQSVINQTGLVTDDKIDALKSDLDDYKDSISEYHKSVNLFDKSKITDGKILQGQNNEQTISGCFYTDYIPVDGGKTYCFQDNTGYLGQNGKVICGYDANKTFISAANQSDVIVRDGAVIFSTEESKYVRVNGRTSRIDSFMFVEGDTLPSYEPYYEPYYEIKREALPQMLLPSGAEHNPLYGKKIALNGDSICYGAGSTGGFGKIIADANNMSMSNIAVSGGTLATGTIIQGVNRHWISSTIQNMPNDADYYILDGGINDSDTSLGVTLGEITSGYGSTFDTTTLSGAMESICYQLQTIFKGKKYGFIFVHNCYGYTGRWTTEFRPRMKEILKKWGIPYLDLSEECPQLRNIDALRIYTASNDGWHPTEEGYKLFYVPKITAWMKTL